MYVPGYGRLDVFEKCACDPVGWLEGMQRAHTLPAFFSPL